MYQLILIMYLDDLEGNCGHFKLSKRNQTWLEL
jgi:hypothetical protein